MKVRGRRGKIVCGRECHTYVLGSLEYFYVCNAANQTSMQWPRLAYVETFQTTQCSRSSSILRVGLK